MLVKTGPNTVINLENADSIELNEDFSSPDTPGWGIYARFGETVYTVFKSSNLEATSMVFERLVTVMGGATEVVENGKTAVLITARNLHRGAMQEFGDKND